MLCYVIYVLFIKVKSNEAIPRLSVRETKPFGQSSSGQLLHEPGFI